jgi:hypothetical protein
MEDTSESKSNVSFQETYKEANKLTPLKRIPNTIYRCFDFHHSHSGLPSEKGKGVRSFRKKYRLITNIQKYHRQHGVENMLSVECPHKLIKGIILLNILLHNIQHIRVTI